MSVVSNLNCCQRMWLYTWVIIAYSHYDCPALKIFWLFKVKEVFKTVTNLIDYNVHGKCITDNRLRQYTVDMQCFNSISESSSEIVEEKLFHDNLTLLKSTEKCWLEWDLNSHLWDTGLLLYLLTYWAHWDWMWVFVQRKHMRCSCNNFFNFFSTSFNHSQYFLVDFGCVRLSWNNLSSYTAE